MNWCERRCQFKWLREKKGRSQLSVEKICTKVYKFKYLHVSWCLIFHYSSWRSNTWLCCPLMGISCHDTQVFETVGLVWQIRDKMCKTCTFLEGQRECKRTPSVISEGRGCLKCEIWRKPYYSQWRARINWVYLIFGVYFKVSWTALNYLAILITFPLIVLGSSKNTSRSWIPHCKASQDTISVSADLYFCWPFQQRYKGWL